MTNKIIGYPLEHTEFEIQAYLYVRLRDMGFNVRGEVRFSDKSEVKGRRQCRFDIVIYDKHNKPIEIIEVKSAKNPERVNCETTRQAIKYKMFNMPLTYIINMEQAFVYLKQKEQVVAGNL